MPGVVRYRDKCTGHGGYPPRPNNKASTNVFINSLGAHRRGDTWEEHCSGDSCHGGTTIGGSSSVFVNGKKLARKGDAIDCGSYCLECSPNVFAGD